jgi:hypothetical protein
MVGNHAIFDIEKILLLLLLLKSREGLPSGEVLSGKMARSKRT